MSLFNRFAANRQGVSPRQLGSFSSLPTVGPDANQTTPMRYDEKLTADSSISMLAWLSLALPLAASSELSE